MSAAARPEPGAGESLWSSPGAVAGLAFVYCLAFLLLRNLLSQTIAVDDVEALIAVQDLRLGYRAAQPPLHGWLLWLAEQGLGPGLLALSLVKYGLLFGTLVLFHAAARRLTARSLSAALATLSLTLIFLIGYKVHRGYTHTATLLFTCAATFYLFVLLRERRGLLLYGLFGLAAGLGLLSKYNALALLVGLLIAGLATPAWRPVVLSRRMLLSAAVFALVVVPYALWALAYAPVTAGALAQSRLPGEGAGFLAARLTGIGQAFRSAVEFLLPFIALAPLAFPVLLSRRGWQGLWRNPGIRLLSIQILAAFGFLLLVVAASGTSAFKARHLHPLLMLTPILVFLVIEHKAAARGLAERTLRRGAQAYLAMAVLATLGTAAALTVRATQGPPDCGSCRLQRPYPALGQELQARHGIRQGTLIAGDEFIGGNLRAVLPELRVYSLPYTDVVPPPQPGRDPAICLLVWDAADGERMPDALASFAAKIRGGARHPEAPIERAELPYTTAPAVTYGFRYQILQPAGDCY